MKHGFIKVASATPQIKIADCNFNTDRIISLIKLSEREKVSLLVLPELCLSSSSCGNLFLQRILTDSVKQCILKIAEKVPDNMVVIFGAPIEIKTQIYSCYVVASAGKILGIVPKKLIRIPCSVFTLLPQSCLKKDNENVFGEESVIFSDYKIPFGSNLIFSCIQMPSFCFSCGENKDFLTNIVVVSDAFKDRTGEKEKKIKFFEVQSELNHCAYIYANAGKGESTTDNVFSGDNLICENGTLLCYQRMNEDKLLISEIDLENISYQRKKDYDFYFYNSCECKFGYESKNIKFNFYIVNTELTRKYEKLPFAKIQYAEETLCLQARGLESRLNHLKCNKVFLGISGGLDSTLALFVSVRAFKNLSYSLKNIICVSMPCFGTSERTLANSRILVENVGTTFRLIDIKKTVLSHFEDISQNAECFDTAYENSQARERTQVLMDLANKENGLVVGTGDFSELVLGWATFNGDHISNYSVNSGVPKTAVRALVEYEMNQTENKNLKKVLSDILNTPVSPELIPGKQETEEIIGSYELHDFFINQTFCCGSSPSKVFRLALYTFSDKYDKKTIFKNLNTFYKRFFSQQFKRNCIPDGPEVFSVSLSPRLSWNMPSDASVKLWEDELKSCSQTF